MVDHIGDRVGGLLCAGGGRVTADGANGAFQDRNRRSWGRVARRPHKVASPRFRDEVQAVLVGGCQSYKSVLGVGLGRSYSDSCLNPDGAVVDTTALDRLIAFDGESGVLRVESGASLWDILEFAVPRGFFLPTTPGTRYVTVGGAVANDVHGKNHHRAGTFGNHVLSLGLMRSDGQELRVSRDQNPDLFQATVGGLGLTGLILWADLKLTRIPSSHISQQSIPFHSVSEFFDLACESERDFEHTVAWVDCLSAGDNLGRGIFSRGNWSEVGSLTNEPARNRLSIPFDPPAMALNQFSVRAFNEAYFKLNKARAGESTVKYGPFFYPLDAIRHWNRMYGAQGFYQYQSVVPPNVARDATAEMLKEVSHSGQGSFLAVLKTFGDVKSPGMLSFPAPGATLALDFPNRGEETLRLLSRLDRVVDNAGGRLYPAKDGRLPPEQFWRGYPDAETFREYVDPKFSSEFWRRMIAG